MKNVQPLVERGRSLDDVLIELSAAGRSPLEISQRIGGVLTPEQVAVRVNQVLAAPDWLTEAQQERALLQLVRINLLDLRAKVEGERVTLDQYHDSVKIQLAYVDRIFDRYNRRAAATEEELNTYNANVGRQLGRVVDLVLSYMRGALRDEIDAAEWDRLVHDAMEVARVEIASKQIEAS